MSNPERIHINWNASEGFELFKEHGIPATNHDIITPEHIMTVLASQAGQFFRLMVGWTDDPPKETNLSIRNSSEEGLTIRNHVDPTFEGVYVVASEPPPRMTMHGDYLFDLVSIESIN